MRLFGGSDEERFESIVSQGAVIAGNVSAKGPVRVDGRVEGDVRSEDAVVIGPDGEVQGNVTARAVTIGGRVNGRVEAAERVELLETGRLSGEVWSPRLAMEEGATYDGQVKMGATPAPKSAVPRAAKRREASPPAVPEASEG